MRHRYRKKIIKYMFFILFAIVFFVWSSIQSDAAQKRTVRVAFPSQSGMSEVGESGDLIGYNHLYLQSLAEYAGWNIEYVTYDDLPGDEGIMKAMQQIMSGEVDLLGPMLYSDAVAEMFEFPENNYGIVYTTLCTLEKSNLTSINYIHSNPLRIAIYSEATTRNQEVKDYLEQLGINYQLVECKSTAEQIDKLEEGKADVLSSITLSYFEGTRTVSQFAPRPYYFVSTKGNTELITQLDKATEKLNYTQPKLQEELQNIFFGDTSGGYVLTDEENEYMKNFNSLDVLCAANYAPYCLKSKNGMPSGVLVSLLDDFAKDNGIKVNYTFCDNLTDLEKEWKTGGYDCIIGLPFTSDYCIRNGIIRSSAVITTNMEIYGESQKKSYEESSVAVYGEFTNQMNLDAFKEIIQYPSLKDCFKAVETGKADYGCANQLSVDYEIFEHAYSFIATPLLGEQLNICVAVDSDMNSSFLSALNKYIATLPDNTITAYLSEASRHEDIDSFILLARKQPLFIALVITAVAVLTVLLIMLMYNANKRKKWNAQLQTANEALQKATEAKSEFLSQMSHDIRTPMNAILGFAKLGREDIASPKLLEEDLDKISSSGEFLLGLVNDILDMTKIESHVMELKPEIYSRIEFERQIDALVLPLCLEKQIIFFKEFAEDMPECLFIDKLRFNQIFFNLLSNAVKFTPEHGQIKVMGKCLENDGKKAKIFFIVQDNGIGMSEEFQKQMFNSFSQEEQHISTEQGTGLGLSIVKSFVELMNGSIQVESKLGEGSCFRIELPVEVCDLPKKEETIVTAVKKTTLEGKKILLCEDHPINTRLVCRLLEKIGVEVVCAANGKEGVERYKASLEQEFSLILMDIRMPVMDGIEATKIIRNLERLDAKTIPIIAMTANAFDDDVQKCLAAGMTAHLAKPFDVDKFYAVIAGI